MKNHLYLLVNRETSDRVLFKIAIYAISGMIGSCKQVSVNYFQDEFSQPKLLRQSLWKMDAIASVV